VTRRGAFNSVSMFSRGLGMDAAGRIGSRPKVSIVIATYNWSAVLRRALRSVALQTFSDFEVLVVGDHCTDDSEAVVDAFGDPRFKWHNLAKHYGGQWAPNNYGIEQARGDWIAYLGHDDIWYPTHLERGLSTAAETDADLVASIMILYGPPGPDAVYGLSGVFADGVFAPDDFMPPSSVMHRRSLITRIGPWQPPETLDLPVDCQFIKDAIEAGARIAPTNELTAFKFNAAWRRDAYRTRTTDQQDALLARIEGQGDFRPGELIKVLQAIAADRFIPIKMPKAPYRPMSRRYKGATERFAPNELRHIEDAVRFPVPDEYAGLEWHSAEQDARYGPYRWIGPSPKALLDLPVVLDRDLMLRVHVLQCIDAQDAARLRLSANGEPLETTVETTQGDTYLVSARLEVPKRAEPTEGLRLTFEVAEVRQPFRLGINEDRRWLGVPVNWIELRPVGWIEGPSAQ
jgi:hypothetical protein